MEGLPYGVIVLLLGMVPWLSNPLLVVGKVVLGEFLHGENNFSHLTARSMWQLIGLSFVSIRWWVMICKLIFGRMWGRIYVYLVCILKGCSLFFCIKHKSFDVWGIGLWMNGYEIFKVEAQAVCLRGRPYGPSSCLPGWLS